MIGQWARYGYIRSSWSSEIPRVYSFQDVAEAIVVHELVDRGVKHGAIKTAIDELRSKYGDWPLQTAPIVTPDEPGPAGIALRDEGGVAWDVGARRGQTYLSFVELSQINKLLRRGGWAVRDVDNISHIEVDPDRLSGRPTIRDRRMPAEKVARIARLPGGLRVLASEYDIGKREADDAVRWYERALELTAAA